jgi:hypothetical protein
MWHFTDIFYHTDADRLEMVSAEEMKNVGISALATAFALCAADEQTTLYLIDEVEVTAIDRLMVEAELSKEAIQKGAKLEEEQHILDVWSAWYTEAIEKMADIQVGGASKKVEQKIAKAKASILKKNEILAKTLTGGN